MLIFLKENATIFEGLVIGNTNSTTSRHSNCQICSQKHQQKSLCLVDLMLYNVANTGHFILFLHAGMDWMRSTLDITGFIGRKGPLCRFRRFSNRQTKLPVIVIIIIRPRIRLALLVKFRITQIHSLSRTSSDLNR